MMFTVQSENRMQKLYDNSSSSRLTDDDRLVIFSDLHMGNGGRRDDFVHNAPMFKKAMKDFYMRKGFDLALNGDVEELHKFLLKKITRKWRKVFDIFGEMVDRWGLYKINGNHDSEKWMLGAPSPLKIQNTDSLKLDYQGNKILIFHGHQASLRSDRLETAAHYLLRYGARPLAINNFSVSNNQFRKYMIEKRAYEFAKKKKIMAVIGHTHRPLFESLSKVDYLKFRIEQMIREYPRVNGTMKSEIEKKIKKYRDELHRVLRQKKKEDHQDSLYNEGVVVPCLFNSGCGVGKRGMTAIEIDRGDIRLVHWFDASLSSKYFSFNGYSPERLEESNFYRVVLKSDSLKYIFSRINLLA